ncbi:hypothetical protein F4809DRAFT_301974 [Biscogniauxia mediterranea]|nr:hypothetical protein F4809DRAFT_301974 [Biscogniauxia mediterranea]
MLTYEHIFFLLLFFPLRIHSVLSTYQYFLLLFISLIAFLIVLLFSPSLPFLCYTKKRTSVIHFGKAYSQPPRRWNTCRKQVDVPTCGGAEPQPRHTTTFPPFR